MRLTISEEGKKGLSILHFALLGGLVMMTVVMYLTKDASTLHFDLDFSVFLIVGLVIAMTAAPLGIILSSRKLDEIASETSSSGREDDIRAAFILKWAMIEGPALINIIFFYLSGNLFHLVISGMLIILLILHKPNFE